MKYLRTAGFSAAVLGLGAAAQAQVVIIDNFTQGTDTLTMNSTGFIEGQESGFNIAGLQRDSLLNATSNPFGQPMTLNISGNPNAARRS